MPNVTSLDGKFRNERGLEKPVVHSKSWSLSVCHFMHIHWSWSRFFKDTFPQWYHISKCERELETARRTYFLTFPCLFPIFPCSTNRFKADWRQLLLHVLPSWCRAGGLESAHACSWSDVMSYDKLRPRWAPRAPLPTPQAPPRRRSGPLPLAHPWAKISHCRLSDARPRTQPLTKGAHWLPGDASPKSAWLCTTETKGWG